MRHDRITTAAISLHRPGAVAALLARGYEGLAYERLAVLYLDRDFRLAGITEIDGGDTVALPIRRIAREAVSRRASAVVIAHNHPGGEATPSLADRLATRRLAEALRPLAILLVDHLVFGAGEWVSFHRRGWL